MSNSLKGMTCVSVVKYIMIVSIFDIFILGGIGGGRDGAWGER